MHTALVDRSRGVPLRSPRVGNAAVRGVLVRAQQMWCAMMLCVLLRTPDQKDSMQVILLVQWPPMRPGHVEERLLRRGWRHGGGHGNDAGRQQQITLDVQRGGVGACRMNACSSHVGVALTHEDKDSHVQWVGSKVTKIEGDADAPGGLCEMVVSQQSGQQPQRTQVSLLHAVPVELVPRRGGCDGAGPGADRMCLTVGNAPPPYISAMPVPVRELIGGFHALHRGLHAQHRLVRCPHHHRLMQLRERPRTAPAVFVNSCNIDACIMIIFDSVDYVCWSLLHARTCSMYAPRQTANGYTEIVQQHMAQL